MIYHKPTEVNEENITHVIDLIYDALNSLSVEIEKLKESQNVV